MCLCKKRTKKPRSYKLTYTTQAPLQRSIDVDNSIKYMRATGFRSHVWDQKLQLNYTNYRIDIFCPILVLESRMTTVFIPGKKYGEEADQQVTISVQTNFWSFVDVDSSSKKHIQKENFLIGQMVKHMPCYDSNSTIAVICVYRYFNNQFCQCFPKSHNLSDFKSDIF